MKNILTLLFFIAFTLNSTAQYTFSASCVAGPVFNNYSEMTGGKSQLNQVTVKINGKVKNSGISNWKITVRLLKDYTEPSKGISINSQRTSLLYNTQTFSPGQLSSIGFSNYLFTTLNSNSETDLVVVNDLLTGNVTRDFYFNLNVQGGSDLLTVPNGIYGSTYEFKLYETINGVTSVASSFTTPTQFEINYSGNYVNNSVALQNGAGQFNLAFNTISDFANGVSSTVVKGLKVTSDKNYQLSVKAADSFLTSAISPSTLPVSVLKVGLSTNPAVSGLAINSPFNLTGADQPIAQFNSPVPSTSAIEYDLTFSIAPNDPKMFVTPGMYSTFVYFVFTPQ